MIRRTLLFPLTSLGLFGFLVLLLAGSNLYTFHRLTDESPIAELQFRKIGAEQYEATIAYGDFCHPEKFLLHGDQWRLEVFLSGYGSEPLRVTLEGPDLDSLVSECWEMISEYRGA